MSGVCAVCERPKVQHQGHELLCPINPPGHIATHWCAQELIRSDRCGYCGFENDTPKRAHDFIHQQGEALIEYRGVIRDLNTYAAFATDALKSIREHCAAQPSALARAIVATCDAALAKLPKDDAK